MFFILLTLSILLITIIGIVIYRYLRQKQEQFISQDKYEAARPTPESLGHLLRPHLAFLGFACLHFTACMFARYHLQGRDSRIFIAVALLSPGYVLSSPILFLLNLLPISSTFLEDAIYILAALFSSFFYGIMGRFLMSGKIHLRLISVIVVCLLIFFGCYVMFLAALSPT